MTAWPQDAMFFRQVFLRAADRAALTAGSSSATSMPMMVITTSSSTSVKPRRAGGTF